MGSQRVRHNWMTELNVFHAVRTDSLPFHGSGTPSGFLDPPALVLSLCELLLLFPNSAHLQKRHYVLKGTQFSHSVVPDSLLPHGLQNAVLSIPVHHQSQSLLKLMSIESVMPSNYLILCCPFLLLPSIFPSIRVFSNESALRIRWPKVWSFSFSISPSNKYSRLISFLGWTGWISLQSKGVSRVFSNTTAQKHLYVVFDVLLCI